MELRFFSSFGTRRVRPGEVHVAWDRHEPSRPSRTATIGGTEDEPDVDEGEGVETAEGAGDGDEAEEGGGDGNENPQTGGDENENPQTGGVTGDIGDMCDQTALAKARQKLAKHGGDMTAAASRQTREHLTKGEIVLLLRDLGVAVTSRVAQQSKPKLAELYVKTVSSQDAQVLEESRIAKEIERAARLEHDADMDEMDQEGAIDEQDEEWQEGEEGDALPDIGTDQVDPSDVPIL